MSTELTINHDEERNSDFERYKERRRDIKRKKMDEQWQTDRIPRHEQDEDRWRFVSPMPGRDPATGEKSLGL
jgi:hypothetical protein